MGVDPKVTLAKELRLCVGRSRWPWEGLIDLGSKQDAVLTGKRGKAWLRLF